MPDQLPAAAPVIDDAILQEIAAELARAIYPIDEVLRRFNVKPDEFARIVATPHFRSMHAEAQIVWNSSLNARDRTKLKSEVMLEKMLEPGWRAFNDAAQPLAARVAMMQTVARIAGMYEQPKEGAPPAEVRPGDKFTININLSAPPAKYANGEAARVINIQQTALDLPPSDPLEEVIITGNTSPPKAP